MLREGKYYRVATFLSNRVPTTYRFWLDRVMKAAGKAKAPLVHSEALVWVNSCVGDFGAGVLPVTQIIAFAASELEHVNPKVGPLLQVFAFGCAFIAVWLVYSPCLPHTVDSMLARSERGNTRKGL